MVTQFLFNPIIASIFTQLFRSSFSFWSLIFGLGIGAALTFTLLFSQKKPQNNVHSSEDHEAKLHDLVVQHSQTVNGLNQEVQKLQQRLLRVEERCLSYQKLVEVHQEELKILRQDNHQLGEDILQKERKLNELYLAQLEPDLFDTERRKTELSYLELKKKYDDKVQGLEKIKSRLFQIESDYLTLKKSKEEEELDTTDSSLIEQLKTSEEERKRLESELSTLQQVVSTLSTSNTYLKKKKPKSLSELHNLSE